MPTVIYGMLKEEKQRNLELQEAYAKEIKLLPKGSLVAKRRNGRTYYYLRYREKDKVKTDYVGKDDSSVEDIRRGIAKRKQLEIVARRLRTEYKQICKIVKE